MTSKRETHNPVPKSPVYEGRPVVCMVAGLPHDEVYRGMQRARAFRNAYLKSLVSRFIAGSVRKLGRIAKGIFTIRIDSLHRSSFTSII